MPPTLFVFAIALGLCGCQQTPGHQQPHTSSNKPSIPQAPQHHATKDPTRNSHRVQSTAYHRTIQEIKTARQKFFTQYTSATPHQRSNIVQTATAFLTRHLLHHFIPAWYGIPWAFVGKKTKEESPLQYQARKQSVITSQRIENPYQPGVTTNCSLLLSTTLKHLGFQVERYRLSWQMSYDIIRSLTPSRNIVWLQNKPMKDFIKQTHKMGKGIFIVGLDFHTGYIVYGSPLSTSRTPLPEDVYFCHADYGQSPQIVRCELAVRSPVLTSSRVRVVGKIFSQDRHHPNPDLIHAWILSKKIRTVGNYNH